MYNVQIRSARSLQHNYLSRFMWMSTLTTFYWWVRANEECRHWPNHFDESVPMKVSICIRFYNAWLDCGTIPNGVGLFLTVWYITERQTTHGLLLTVWYITEGQTIQRPKEKGQKDKQRSTKHTHKTKDQVTRTPIYLHLFCFFPALLLK
jgi:hypothetical protein